ncbi:MAG: hypothetical protein ACTSUO_09745 [Candidatus Thorarchaeota archaeon]
MKKKWDLQVILAFVIICFSAVRRISSLFQFASQLDDQSIIKLVGLSIFVLVVFYIFPASIVWKAHQNNQKKWMWGIAVSTIILLGPFVALFALIAGSQTGRELLTILVVIINSIGGVWLSYSIDSKFMAMIFMGSGIIGVFVLIRDILEKLTKK